MKSNSRWNKNLQGEVFHIDVMPEIPISPQISNKKRNFSSSLFKDFTEMLDSQGEIELKIRA